MHSDEFHSMVTYPCSACGRRVQQTEELRCQIGGRLGRLCNRCLSSGFTFTDDNEVATNQAR